MCVVVVVFLKLDCKHRVVKPWLRWVRLEPTSTWLETLILFLRAVVFKFTAAAVMKSGEAAIWRIRGTVPHAGKRLSNWHPELIRARGASLSAWNDGDRSRAAICAQHPIEHADTRKRIRPEAAPKRIYFWAGLIRWGAADDLVINGKGRTLQKQ